MLRLPRQLSNTFVKAAETIRMASISAGLKGEANTFVEANKNTARRMKSGNLDVFATPWMIALMEEAASAALQSSLGVGETTVRTQFRVLSSRITRCISAFPCPRFLPLCPETIELVRSFCGLVTRLQVGTSINVTHERATPIGGTIRATAEVTAVEGRRISFALAAFDGTVTPHRHLRIPHKNSCTIVRRQAASHISYVTYAP